MGVLFDEATGLVDVAIYLAECILERTTWKPYAKHGRYGVTMTNRDGQRIRIIGNDFVFLKMIMGVFTNEARAMRLVNAIDDPSDILSFKVFCNYIIGWIRLIY